jgi:hypothetical protein
MKSRGTKHHWIRNISFVSNAIHVSSQPTNRDPSELCGDELVPNFKFLTFKYIDRQ